MNDCFLGDLSFPISLRIGLLLQERLFGEQLLYE